MHLLVKNSLTGSNEAQTPVCGRFGMLIALMLVLSVAPAVAEPSGARDAIAESYREADAAYGRSDIDGVFRAFSSGFVLVDQSGREHRIPELRSAMTLNWRRPPHARRVVRHAETTLTSIAVVGDEATVRGTGDVSMQMVDDFGTSGGGHDRTRFEDTWRRTGDGWRIVKELVVDFHRTVRANPSQQAQAAIGIIRQNTQNMMEFDRSVNFGQCVSSESVRRYNYQERMRRCER